MRLLLALDPGATVGWASFHLPNKERQGYRMGQIRNEALWGLLESTKMPIDDQDVENVHLVVEMFVYRYRPKVDLTPAESVGVIKEWARQNDVKVSWQAPSQAMYFWTDDRLKDYGLYLPARPHANDAMRHLLYFLHFSKENTDFPKLDPKK